MNRANYTLTNKYPLSTEGLAFIQGQILTAQKMCASLGSGCWIIDGCEETTENGVATISAGAVVIDKEIVEVAAQSKQATCYIRETTNATPNRVVRELIFGTSVDSSQNKTWANFSRVDISDLAKKEEVEALRNLVLPKGAIIMWSGTVNESDEAFPSGFKLCDGRTVTGYGTIPDLRSRFIVGYDERTANQAIDYSEIGKIGGESKHSLSIDEMPAHTHTYSRCNIASKGEAKSDSKYRVDGVYVQGTTSSTGGGEAHENRPPYYVLAFLIKVV